MSIKKINDQDIFENVINIGLRMYGNGYSYSKNIIQLITEYCRQQIRYYFLKHYQLINNNNTKRITYLHTLIYNLRHKRFALKRFEQFLQAKDRSISQQDEIMNNIRKEKKISIDQRFKRICHQLKIQISNHQLSILDEQRSRQYARLDTYYNSDQLTSNEYLIFVEQQHTSFNNLRLLSSIDINHWLNLNDFNLTNQEIRLGEICLFLIKEILLNLMDKLYSSSIPCQINDILRRQYVYKSRRLLYSRRKRKLY